ncbi:MAG: class I SAM-dependent methyltransferase [Actinomycetota bacterium]|nr:class I SAM-dependent methyltransferase [Actinomycetota bacterium]
MDDQPEDQRTYWNRRAGEWERRAGIADAPADTYGGAAMDALGLGSGASVLDVGCGVGATVVELARRVAPDGRVIGVDVSDEMLAACGRTVGSAGVTGVELVRSDVVDGALDDLEGSLDAVFSRFGVMFFPEPQRAFTRLAGLLRPGGSLRCVVWGPIDANPWMFVPVLAAAGVFGAGPELPPPGRPGPFSLADADLAAGLLAQAGLRDVGVEPVTGLRLIPSAAPRPEIETLVAMGPLGDAWLAADDTTRDAVIEAVIAAMEPYRTDGGWMLPGSAQVIGGTAP